MRRMRRRDVWLGGGWVFASLSAAALLLIVAGLWTPFYIVRADFRLMLRGTGVSVCAGDGMSGTGWQLTVSFKTGGMTHQTRLTRVPGVSWQTIAPVPAAGKRLDIVRVSLFWPAALFAGMAILCRWRAGPRRRAGDCANCGYSLEGLAGACPECGQAVGGRSEPA